MKETMNKKTLIIAGSSIIGFFIVILVVVWVISLFKPNFLSYEKVEEKIVKATEKYYKDNPTLLPIYDGEYSILYSTLVSSSYIEPLNEILEDADKCTVSISVIKYAENYSYIPYLNCPGSYETKELYRTITDNVVTVTSGSGLYRSDDGTLYYKGEVTNNYVVLGINEDEKNVLWRIVSINNDNSIKIIKTESTEGKYTWDNRYNVDKGSTSGYNDFEVSRLKDTLKSFETNNIILPDTLKSKLVAKSWCVGKREINAEDNSGNTECSVLSADSLLFGALTVYEYIRASLDENCAKVTDRSCSNYNYLSSFLNNSWFLTGVAENTHKVYSYNTNLISDSTASNDKKLMIVTHLSNKVFYKSGNGTLTDPYIIK